MDHWGDPWADNNADDDKSPTKREIASPLPPTQTSAPGLLNGFLDDAGWGNEDGGFGDWAMASVPETRTTVATETRVQDSGSFGQHEEVSGYSQWDLEEKEATTFGHDAGDWSEAARDSAGNLDNERSETSGSSTTIQPDDATELITTDIPQTSSTDDASSARASTSPSETSHNDAPVESPRTSIEEEQSRDSSVPDSNHKDDPPTKDPEDIMKTVLKSETAIEGGFESGTGNFTNTYRALNRTDAEREPVNNAFEELGDLKIARRQSVTPPALNNADPPIRAKLFPVDPILLDQLFLTPHPPNEVGETPDDPIYSTGGRKAWYRLTRKQTMREYNSGAADDNHVRVTWANSQIRSDVNKIVGRWAREDRISGTGPGARASFYWDTSAPVDSLPISKHSRTLSTVPTPRVAAPVRQSLPPIPTNTPAAFNWSSPTASINPWNQSPGFASTPPPISPPYNAVGDLQEKSTGVSLKELISPQSEQTSQKRTLTSVAETPAVASLILPPPSTTPVSSSDPWSGLEALDTDKTVHSKPATEPFDDDDEWGEMVSTPTVSTPTTGSMSQATTLNNTLSISSSTPQSIEALPAKDESADAMHASPIVRLKSTISPTSAIFGAKSFVPLHVEHGPIGPGLLKPANRSASGSSKTSKLEVQSSSISVIDKPQEKTSHGDGLIDVFVQKPALAETVPDNAVGSDSILNLAFATQTLEPSRSVTPPPAAIPAQPSMDSWADADFSFFESAAPAPTQSKSDLSSVSVFGTPPRSTSAASSAKPFTRSPPRNLTPPPLQPLTGATNSAQRRKEEEEEVLREILSGLPDLRYMLR